MQKWGGVGGGGGGGGEGHWSRTSKKTKVRGSVTRVEGVDRVKEAGVHPHPQQAEPKMP
jgi:hypothetical protein